MFTFQDQQYARRIKGSIIAACVIHAAALVLPGLGPGSDYQGPGPLADDEPIVIDLAPEQQMARRFVDAAASPADRPVSPDTDLISDRDSKASDIEEREDGTRDAPRFEEPSEFDHLGGTPQPPMEVASVPPIPDRAPGPRRAPQPESAPPAPESPAPEPEEREAAVASTEPETPAEESSAEDPPAPDDERFEMAQAPAPEPQPRAGKPRGRLDGRAQGLGFVGFEALSHELGPYLKEIRGRVERRWHAALEMKFSGAARTQAVLDCVISPKGELVSVEIVEAGNSATFAAICKEAMERSAPFPPFPFDVPAVYRNRNLEIRWTFSFM